jgi:hypothetical protein
MDLKEYCLSSNKDDLFRLAIKLCERSIPIWDKYASTNKLAYRDTVVGMYHEVRPQLLRDAILYCHKKTLNHSLGKLSLKDLLNEFSDPIVSLEDLDWELPYPVERIFYAVHNLLEGIQKPITIFNESCQYVSINQAVDALQESGLMDMVQIRNTIYGNN